MRILHIIVAGQIGGAERFLVNLAQHQEWSGAEHCIALMTPSVALRNFFEKAGLSIQDRGPVQENPLAYLWRSWGPQDLHWLGSVIAKTKPDILHCHTYGSHVLTARAGLHFNLPVVRTEHGVRHYADPTCGLFRHWSLHHTTQVIAVSNFVGARVESVAPYMKGKVRVVHNGIDLSHFAPQPMQQETPLRLTVLSRLEPIKRLSIAIEAIAQIPDTVLDVVGDGAERQSLEALAATLGVSDRVHFHSHQRDPRPFLAASHAVLNTTREEGLSLSLIEAAAMARPAIGFAAGGVPEVVEDGQTGWLTTNQTTEGLAEAIKIAAGDPAELAFRGIKARERVEKAFGLKAMCEGYGAVYRDLLSKPAHS
jgi:glycosyltransferase involved in cell wall biosynthesis